MLTSRALPFLPGARALHRYRQSLQQTLTGEVAFQLLPALRSLPLSLEPLPDPEAIHAQGAQLAICGPPASGRTLALLQVAEHWVTSRSASPLLYVSLARDDAPNLSPRAVVAGLVHRAGLPSAFGEARHPGMLLVDDWELLPADRRRIWREALTSGDGLWPALRLVIALPREEAWPTLHLLHLPGVDATRAAAWLNQLLPEQDQQLLRAALQPAGGLLEASLADIALLALTVPHAGMPTSRAELYERAFALVQPGLEREAGEQPPLRVGRALLRHYRIARGLAGSAELARLADLPPAERAAVAPLAAGLLGDPTPVLAALWQNGAPAPADLPALVACISTAPERAASWALRLIEQLAAPAASTEAQAALARLSPLLPSILASAAASDLPRARSVLDAAHRALALAPGHWLSLVDNPVAPENLRWAAADLIAREPPTAQLLATPPSAADTLSRQARAYLAAAAGPAGMALLATPPLAEGAAALLDDPAAGERRLALARAIADDAAAPEQLRALALTLAGDRALVEQVAIGGAPTLRRAALAALQNDGPEATLAALARLLANPVASDTVRREALDAAAAIARPEALGLLARAALDAQLHSAVRLHAVDLLAGCGLPGLQLLRRMLEAAGMPPVLRAAAAGHLGRLGAYEALPVLRNLLERDAPPLLRRAAATALGALGRRPDCGDQAAAALITGLRRVGVDTVLAVRITRALGHTGANAALPTLVALLKPELSELLRTAWERRAPELAHHPASRWPELELALEVRIPLMDALADGATLADQPTSVGELVTRQATHIASAAAAALATLVRARPELSPAALRALRRAATSEPRAEVARAALDALARIGDAETELAAILDDNTIAPQLRWLAVEQLSGSARARALLVRRLDEGDSFLRATIVATLGARGHQAALPAIRRLARDDAAEPQLRRAAVTALTNFSNSEASAALLAVACEAGASPELRILAATGLPRALSSEARGQLHAALRAPRLPAELSVALARALARSGDHEALPVLLRLVRSDTSAAAVASLEAIAELGDTSVEPLLVALSQSHLAPPGVRLAAVAALLRLCGTEHLTLLRDHLAAAAPPLRMQAYAALAAVGPDDPRLGEPLADGTAPLALRLQALAHLARHDPTTPALGTTLTRSDEEPQLRLAAAAALARGGDDAPALLAAVLHGAPETALAPALLRRRCITVLGDIARSSGPTADAALARLVALASAADQPEEQRHWATEVLLGT